MDDLASGNILGAIRTGGSLRNTLKGSNVSSLVASGLVSSAISVGTKYITNGSRNGNNPFSIPSLGSGISGISKSAMGLFSAGFDSLSDALPDLGSITNSFGGVSTSANQMAEKFTSGINLNTSDYTGMFATMQASMEPGMAVAEMALAELASDVSSGNIPSISNLHDSIPSADSLTKIASDIAPVLNNASKSFAPIAQDISKQMKQLSDSGELRRMTTNLSNTVGSVFSNGVNVGR
jgi:hypothetical protein